MDTSLLTVLINLGTGGIVVALIIARQLVPGWTYREQRADTASWKGLYESERTAHQLTRDAYTLQGERLQVAVESGKVTEQLLREARSRVATAPD